MGLWGRKKNGKPYPKEKKTQATDDENTRKLILANTEEMRVINDLSTGKIKLGDAIERLEPIEQNRIDIASKIAGIKVEKKEK